MDYLVLSNTNSITLAERCEIFIPASCPVRCHSYYQPCDFRYCDSTSRASPWQV